MDSVLHTGYAAKRPWKATALDPNLPCSREATMNR